MLLRAALRLLFVFTLLAGVAPVKAADIKVMTSAGFFQVYSELGPVFENETGTASSPPAVLRSAIRQK